MRAAINHLMHLFVVMLGFALMDCPAHWFTSITLKEEFMDLPFVRHTESFSTLPQIAPDDLSAIAAAGFRSIINNRPDGEGGASQPASGDIERAARAAGLRYAHLPVVSGRITPEQVAEFGELLATLPPPVLAFCRTGTRSANLFKMVNDRPAAPVASSARSAGTATGTRDVVIVGGGAAGIGVAASLLKRQSNLKIAIIEPSDKHYYQPAWTLVGSGAFDIEDTVRPMARCMPHGVEWIKLAAAGFEPEQNRVVLDNGDMLEYQTLIVCPGIKLNWHMVEGLVDTLGKNGVTSNYRFDLAPYTWQLVQQLTSGVALFTQPPMPIKCAGAPQKAMYLSCDHWRRSGVSDHIKVEFNSSGQVLFGVAAFVPALMEYIKRYNVQLCYSSTLKAVDGPAKKAWFDIKDAQGTVSRVEKSFDMLHVVPPQTAPDFVRESPLAGADGWVDVDQYTLQHPRYPNVFSLGDACSAPNAKTVAAARKQIVVVAENLLAFRAGKSLQTHYDGYGSCPLTVERGKIILAEFGYGNKLLPTFPLDPTVPRYLAWKLKTTILPWVYWDLMLKGREWLARSEKKEAV